MKIIHHIRARLAGADKTLTVENAVNVLTARHETDPGGTGDAESGKQTEAVHPPNPKRKKP